MSHVTSTTVSVITGGAGGMGLATAEIMGRDHLVLIADVRADRLDAAARHLRGLGIECETAECDVTDRRSVEAVAARAASMGRVASVVHTAGVSPAMGSPERIVRINALGTVHVFQAFEPTAGEGFALVNVASSAGHLSKAVPVPTRAYRLALKEPDRFVDKLVSRCRLAPEKLRAGMAYAVSKNFVVWFTRRSTAAMGERGARVVSVSPGSFDTEMGQLEASNGSGELAERSALGRFGRVDEVAELLAFVAGDKAGYLTGTDILVDGGASAVMTIRDILAVARQA